MTSVPTEWRAAATALRQEHGLSPDPDRATQDALALILYPGFVASNASMAQPAAARSDRPSFRGAS